MIKVTVIFGTTAVREYEETNDLSIFENDSIDGSFDEITFNTLEEYNGYCKGLADADGWEETMVLTPEISSNPDCISCEAWRNQFRDNVADVYCPGCGKKLFHRIPEETIEYKGKSYPVRRIILHDVGAVLMGDEELSDNLMKDGEFISGEAERLDTNFYGYISKDGLRLPEEDLILFIRENLM